MPGPAIRLLPLESFAGVHLGLPQRRGVEVRMCPLFQEKSVEMTAKLREKLVLAFRLHDGPIILMIRNKRVSCTCLDDVSAIQIRHGRVECQIDLLLGSFDRPERCRRRNSSVSFGARGRLF